MNPQLEKLFLSGQKEKRLIIGLMSGTSVDGLDIALCEISGSGRETKVHLIAGETIAYDDDTRGRINKLIQRKEADLGELARLHTGTGQMYARLIKQFLDRIKIPAASIDCIASHGQTIFHAPGQQNASLQIGDGDQIAFHTGIITLSDFRQKHIAAGGEGAPLAPYVDLLLFGEEETDVCLLNIGGIANLSFIPAGHDAGGLICGDTGPGNTLMDIWIHEHDKRSGFDKEGMMAATGKADDSLLRSLKDHEYFHRSFPKSTGRELFDLKYIEDAIRRSGSAGLSPEDIMATLNELTATTIADSLLPLCSKTKKMKLYVSGGGKHNPVLMKNIRQKMMNIPVEYHDTEEKGIPADLKEAVIFALLANECVAGVATVFSGNEKYLPAVSMGKISFP